MFTQFYKDNSNTLFLFDEPASNLHPSAQQKILENFKYLSQKKNHQIIYSTHSHHLINVHWIEKTHIVKNYSSNKNGEESEKDKIGIIATIYKQFHNSHPKKIHYYQPILDALKVKVSPLDITKNSLLVEGISDHFAYTYFIKKILKRSDNPYVIPLNGVNAMNPVISILIGLGVEFRVLLDGDKQGIDAKKKYEENFEIKNGETIKTVSELCESKVDTQLEDLFEDDIKEHPDYPKENKNKNKNKKQYAQFFCKIKDEEPLQKFPKTEKNMKPIMDWIAKEFPVKNEETNPSSTLNLAPLNNQHK
ncbi:AAA family ATPase [Candidatus Liberibacter africanus]|uniref:ATP-dependent nuclease n=1 Tax=Liberibacter africanus TaxID=34020 RepID=UPI00339D3198